MKRLALFLVLSSAALSIAQQKWPIDTEADRKPTLSTGGNCLLTHGKVITATGVEFEDADILVQHGKIVKIGKGLSAPQGVVVIDVKGKVVTPGVVDAHSHRGENESNEYTDSAVPEVQIRDVLNPDQEGVWFDLANGITTMLVLHGSADTIGGQSVIVKNRYKATPSEMVFQGAPRVLKFALGENVTQKNDSHSDRFPQTRMGVEAVYRRAFADAKAYMALWNDYRAKQTQYGVDATLKRFGPPPRRDLRLETLADVLRGNIVIHCHSYRQDEMLMMARLSQEFGFKLGTLTHALEGYKIAPELAKAHIPVSMFGEAWDYKLEVFDSIPMGAALCHRAGVLTSVNTDTFSGIAPLQLDAGKMMRYGVNDTDALRAITLYPAKQLGIDRWVGSLEPGKDADIAVWSGHPLSVYAHCDMTLLDGEVMFQRRDAFGMDKVSTFSSSVKPNSLRADLLAPLPQMPRYAIVGGTVHPVSKEDIPNGVVIIEGNKIVAVGGPSTPIPSGTFRVDAKGMQVYPGFVDGGSDIGLGEIGEVKQASDTSENGPFQPDLRAITAMNPESVKFAIARCAGVTTTHIEPAGGLISGQTAVTDLIGFNREGMSLSNSDMLVVNWPEGPNPAFIAFLPPDAVQKQKDDIKVQRDGIRDYFLAAKRALDSGDQSDPRLAALAPFLRGEKPVEFKSNGVPGIKAALALVKEFKFKAVLSGAADAWRIGDQIAAAHVPVLYSAPQSSCPSEASPYSQLDPYDTPFVAVALLRKAGVKVGLMTGDSSLIQDLPNRAGWMCAFGLSKKDAIRSITLDCAEALGVSDRVGSLDPGKFANVLITDGDPLELTTQVLRVFIEGKPVAMKSKFTELYRKYEARISPR